MIPFNRNVNKVNLTLHFEGQCFVFLTSCVSSGLTEWAPGEGPPRHWFDWLLIMMIDNPNLNELVVDMLATE
jgi:hypothetical protein